MDVVDDVVMMDETVTRGSTERTSFTGRRSTNFVQKNILAQKRVARRERLAAHTSQRLAKAADEDVVMIDLIVDPYPVSLTSKRASDEDDLPPSKRTKVSEQVPDPPQARTRRERKGRRRRRIEGYKQRKTAAKAHREKTFLDELISDTYAHWQQTHAYYAHSSSSHHSDDPIPLKEKIRRMREINTQEAIAAAARRTERAQDTTASEDAERCPHRSAESKTKNATDTKERSGQQTRRKARHEDRSWAHEPWTLQRALEHYCLVSELFDTAKFSSDDPLTFEDIPWPVLHRPGTYRAEDIEWSAVETFYASLRPHMTNRVFQVLVEKSHKRFHPDRWRARKVLDGLENSMKAALEMAANTVAQALTPIWAEIKRR